ncbi:phage tail protein [Rhizobium sp. NTR19]|uniref:Phage tail protein n=1 Tax=Neorhizobium turbinariae TaxID=2937795 RepID=A0ABT0IMI9_9HYPH|nr:phage tail tube protein [Neorhizobium turbinariae]MCK8779086.1 phage tail protein [Neorhizobium turbinariae]
MADPTTIRGGNIKVLLGNAATPIVYTAPCGFNQRSVTINKGLEEVNIPDCDNPDAVNWVGRDATSMSMSISGEGLLAAESVETWLDAVEDVESIPIKVEWHFPAKTITWTGKAHVESFEAGAQDGRRVSGNVSLQSDGKMTRVVTPVGG